jgi:hypothetical protein
MASTVSSCPDATLTIRAAAQRLSLVVGQPTR